MAYEKKEKILALVLLGLFLGAVGLHYALAPWGFYSALPPQERQLRLSLVATAEGWLGANEADGSHRAIVDRYNTLDPLPVNYLLGYGDSWCAAFVTVAAMERGLTDIIPPECGCERQIGLFQALGRWEERDDAIPEPGDLIYYDWNVTNQGNNTGWSDHVGIVVGVKWPFVKVIEGNKDDDVSYRVILVGDKTIRGFGMPDYGGK